jgi:hypothetical protein
LVFTALLANGNGLIRLLFLTNNNQIWNVLYFIVTKFAANLLAPFINE